MPSIPETRASLILRLPDATDVEAWDEFVEIYRPLVYRVARGRGFQDADANDVAQEVLVAVAGAVDRWVPDREFICLAVLMSLAVAIRQRPGTWTRAAGSWTWAFPWSR